MKNIHTQTGYTLIELLLYVSIVGSLLTAASLYFATSTESRIKNQSIAEVNQQGAMAIETITYTIRNASSITAPVGGVSDDSLTLVVPTGANSPTIFDESSGVLRSKKGASVTVALTNSKVTVSNLAFTNVTRSGTPGIVRVSFDIARVNPSNRNAYEFQKTFTASAALRDP